MSFTIAEQATAGFSNASHYDQYRPSYPAEAVDRLLENLGVASVNDARIIDLACGTGKFTELLAARPEQYEIVGVEPHHEMRGELIKKDLGSNVKVLEGSASNMPIEEGWADALIAAQVRRGLHQVKSLGTLITCSHSTGLLQRTH
jgi:ubiquinone/menaquinone biosynthesis C-methylase UbiE